MKLTDYIGQNNIFMNFKAADKEAALEELCRLAGEIYHLDHAKILKVVMDREELGSTGLGGGVALPHGKSREVESPALVMAVAPGGVDFDSLDGEPVKVFVLIITPADGSGREHLQLLAKLGGLFKARAAVEELLSLETPMEALEFLSRRAS